MLSPTGPYFKNGLQPISLLAISETARTWPGGTGSYKLALNYTPGFVPQIDAAAQGYDQILWLLEDNSQVDENGNKELKITEVGAMNVFAVLKRDDGGRYALYTITFSDVNILHRFGSGHTRTGWHDFTRYNAPIHSCPYRRPYPR